MKQRELTLESFRQWVEYQRLLQKPKGYTLYAINDLYKYLTGKEPKFKSPLFPRRLKKQFRIWLREVWRPFYTIHKKELIEIGKTWMLGRSGDVMFFYLRKEGE